MKIVYVYIGSTKENSVSNKVKAQIEAFNFNHIETTGLFFSDEIETIVKINDHISVIPLITTTKRKYFQKYYNDQLINYQVLEYLEKISDQYDYIFLREIGVGIAKIRILNKFKNKLLLYIPSNTLRENYLEKKYWGKLGFLSFLIHWSEYFLCFYIWEWFNRKFLYSKLLGIVVFTEEFGRILNSKSFKKLNIVYNRDGVSCRKVKIRKYQIRNTKTIKLLFLKGSSTTQKWSGLDRLIRSINNQNEYQFELFITGFIHNKNDYTYPFIKLVGRLNNEELDALVEEVDIGVSNLANYLIEFNETTNLKTRDYFARGLPFFQANSMPDVDGHEVEKYYLKVPNDNSDINMKDVYDFAIRMREDIEHPQKMRKFAEENLDWVKTCSEINFESLKEKSHR